MKKVLLVACTTLILAACQQSDKTASGADSTEVAKTTDVPADSLHKDGPVLNFETERYDFGKIKKGELVSYSFKFKNTGAKPLIIKEAIATCGCTVPEPPKDPILPGKSSELKVVFHSEGKPVGAVNKPINVISNALNSTVQLLLVGEITE
ncbi:DUF1573 domain-containing protein [Pedobacter sp. JY14-1]|uniref:DUF1573 domain-containing protein n=1 Tax=Pedobacter sp. JY14-1 TaxID=3034151 RepID=UPI0023E1EBB0|nr:DUF1573 domain-containing protein [Pedobacter sp. JY14-1]